MKNPLRKRYGRELKSEFGKYLALFLFLALTIAFVSGFFVADGSMKRSYAESFETYNIEHGHFIMDNPLTPEQLQDAQDGLALTIYPLTYLDRELENEHTIRIYRPRTDVNLVDVIEGAMPQTAGEIVIDRLYAENNELTIGDSITVSGLTFTITGTVALTDYSTLHKNNTDMMFDANKFTVAIVTDEAFDALGTVGIRNCYAWRNDEADQPDRTELRLANRLMARVHAYGGLEEFIPRQQNQAINFAGDDMGSDYNMFMALLYIVIVILAFTFAVTARSTIERESGAVGTLRATGYTRRELLRHYLLLPILVTLAAAVVGNVIGYTVMKKLPVYMYYHSYSLTKYHTYWNANAFIQTTVIPIIIIALVNVLVLHRTLKLPTLQFLRHELREKKRTRVLTLKAGSFLQRFRTRVVLQNVSAYAVLVLGIWFASVLLMFGMMFAPLLDDFKAEVVSSQIADYQYILKHQAETSVSGAEKYSVTSLQNDNKEEITVYGVAPGSAYIPEASDGVLVSNGYLEKYHLKVGDTITLHEKYAASNTYDFTITGSYHYPASLCVFLPQGTFNEIFELEDDAFNGYFTNERLSDIPEEDIAGVITQADLTVMADQLDDSMGFMFPMFALFSGMIYILVMYLLTKMIIDRNANTISMLKILGYTNDEAGKVFTRATALVVLLALVTALPISYFLIRWIYDLVMISYPGWLTFRVEWWIYPGMVAFGAACYLIVSSLLLRSVRKIPMGEALKRQE